MNFGYIASLVPGVNVDPHIDGWSAQHRRRAKFLRELSIDQRAVDYCVSLFSEADRYAAVRQAPWRDRWPPEENC